MTAATSHISTSSAPSKNPRTHVHPMSGLGRVSIRPGSRGGDAEERRYSESMMNGWKQSDPATEPVKSANMGTAVPAEPMEGRAGTKGNPRGQSTHRTQGRNRVSQVSERQHRFHMSVNLVRCPSFVFGIPSAALEGSNANLNSEFQHQSGHPQEK